MAQAVPYKEELKWICAPLLGCSLITLGSLIQIPFYPVPFTLQTFALFTIALTQSPKQAFASASSYLFLGTLGLPVFCGNVNPSWLAGSCGGYLICFPISAYLMAKLRTKMPDFLALLCGNSLLLILGFLWLIPFVGLQLAWTKGFLLFVPSGICKALAAVALTRWWRK